MEVRVFIETNANYTDHDVFIRVDLPSVPRKGEAVYLETEQRKELERRACSSVSKASEYAPKWFFRKSHDCVEPKEEDLKNLSFIDAVEVNRVFWSGKGFVGVVLE